MDIKVLGKQIIYEGCPIVVRQNGETFEFITCINNEIYSSFIVARRSFVQRILLQSYTPEQLHKITNYVIAMAQTTIETVSSKAK